MKSNIEVLCVELTHEELSAITDKMPLDIMCHPIFPLEWPDQKYRDDMMVIDVWQITKSSRLETFWNLNTSGTKIFHQGSHVNSKKTRPREVRYDKTRYRMSI